LASSVVFVAVAVLALASVQALASASLTVVEASLAEALHAVA
jgi:hypothetical protein